MIKNGRVFPENDKKVTEICKKPRCLQKVNKIYLTCSQPASKIIYG